MTTCSACYYFYAKGALPTKDPKRGICRRYPPQIVVVKRAEAEGGNVIVNWRSEFPIVHRNEWCGEFKPK